MDGFMNEKLSRRLSDFDWDNCLTMIRINDAIIKTITEINELFDSGIISIEEYVELGQELWS